MKISPFRTGNTLTTFGNLVEGVIREIRGLDNQYVMKVAQTELEDYYINKVKLEPLVSIAINVTSKIRDLNKSMRLLTSVAPGFRENGLWFPEHV